MPRRCHALRSALRWVLDLRRFPPRLRRRLVVVALTTLAITSAIVGTMYFLSGTPPRPLMPLVIVLVIVAPVAWTALALRVAAVLTIAITQTNAAGAQCGRCGYRLSGLGTVGHCPECGMAYDSERINLYQRRCWNVFRGGGENERSGWFMPALFAAVAIFATPAVALIGPSFVFGPAASFTGAVLICVWMMWLALKEPLEAGLLRSRVLRHDCSVCPKCHSVLAAMHHDQCPRCSKVIEPNQLHQHWLEHLPPHWQQDVTDALTECTPPGSVDRAAAHGQNARQRTRQD